jgi:hypothetical protein
MSALRLKVEDYLPDFRGNISRASEASVKGVEGAMNLLGHLRVGGGGLVFELGLGKVKALSERGHLQ